MKVADLARFGVPESLIAVWSVEFSELTDIQADTVAAGAAKPDHNFLVVAPTSSGKTLIGEIAATTAATENPANRTVFAVPYRALADEQYGTLQRRYGSRLAVVRSTGDWSEFDDSIRRGEFTLAVMTYEKLGGFLVHDASLLDRLSIVVVDEIQMLADAQRGPDLELLLTRILVSERGPRLIGLSASVGDINGVNDWLRAELIASTNRPVPLIEGVVGFLGEALMRDGTHTRVSPVVSSASGKEDLVTQLCRRTVENKEQVVVFAATIPATMRYARQVAAGLPAIGLREDMARALAELEDSETLSTLRGLMASGVAIHNADMTRDERRCVELAFRSGELPVLVSTATLSMGVNLPTDLVVVADTLRPVLDQGRWANVAMTVVEYRNAAGRAGRLGLRKAGTALIAAEGISERDALFEHYVVGTLEPLESQIPFGAFSDLVFVLLCADVAHDADALGDFIAQTFAYKSFYEHRGGRAEVQSAVDKAISECLASELVHLDSGRLMASQVAKVFAARSVGLATAMRLSALLGRVIAADMTPAEIVYEVMECPETGPYPFVDRQDPRPRRAPNEAGINPKSRLGLTLSRANLTEQDAHAIIKTDCLIEWMTGKPHRDIQKRHPRTGLARVQLLGRNVAWLLDCVTAAAKVRGASRDVIERLRTISTEARYGLPAVLAPIAAVDAPTINRSHLMALYRSEREPALVDTDALLDAPVEAFDGILTPLQVARLRGAILSDVANRARRIRVGHIERAELINLPKRIVAELYSANGEALDQAVCDALNYVGLTAVRITPQRTGEADIHVTFDGTIAISVTASHDETRPVVWDKVREVMGAAAGQNPTNLVCIARPTFHNVARENATAIARETGHRRLLLVPIDVLGEAVVRVSEGRMTINELGAFLRDLRGVARVDDLPDHPPT